MSIPPGGGAAGAPGGACQEERLSYQPHTSEDVDRMLTALGLDDVDQLFQHIPSDLRAPTDLDLPRPHAEQEVAAELGRLAARNRHLDELTCFLGAGVYDHYVPASVWYLAGRGEFATSYTPYQPEMSQGVLQALFEYQTLISELTRSEERRVGKEGRSRGAQGGEKKDEVDG